MRTLFLLLFVLSSSGIFAQQPETGGFAKDRLIVVKGKPEKGFQHNYLLFIPKGTPLNQALYLLVEPNNTGKISDLTNVHLQHAEALASVSSVGNNVATELRIPLLVPVFPRPASQPLMYTHALDRDVMLEESPQFHRLDLQLLAMVDDARMVLNALNIQAEPRFLMNGFSASATFTNRFSFLHPAKIKALAMGGFNGKLMLPQKQLSGVLLNYPLGLHDFQELFGQAFDQEAYKALPQYIYMGQLDDNDAVQFDDAYSNSERDIINRYLGKTVQERFVAVQQIYEENGITPIFRTWENVGHQTTGEMNLEVIKFFLKQIKQEAKTK